MPPIRTIALLWSDFEVNALQVASREDKSMARVGFYSGALAVLHLLGTVPPDQADDVARALKIELTDFHEELRKGPSR